MSLPKIAVPTFETKLPSTGATVKYRPMQVREEKVLLVAKQSGELHMKFQSILDVVKACVLSPKIAWETLPIYDVEFVFTQIRANSISNVVTVSFRDMEDEETRDFSVDLFKISVSKPKLQGRFEIPSEEGAMVLTMRHPPISMYTKEFFELDGDKAFDTVLLSCMDKIFVGDNVHDCNGETKEEKEAFINSIPSKTYKEIQDFFQDIPTLHYEIKYKNNKGTEQTIELRGLDDFFTFG